MTKEDLVVSRTAVDNSFFACFCGYTVANAAVSKGKSCVGVFVGPCPFFRVVLLLWRRNASLAGGFAGRLVVWWWCFFLWLDLPFTGTGQLRLSTSFLTAYVSFQDRATVHLRPIPRKKKEIEIESCLGFKSRKVCQEQFFAKTIRKLGVKSEGRVLMAIYTLVHIVWMCYVSCM